MARGLQFTRQWKLLAFLASRKYGATLEELAEKMGCHARTARRDVNVLRAAGMPVEWQAVGETREKRVQVTDGYQRPPIPLTLTEVMAIYFAGNLLKSLRGTPMKEGFESAIAKIEKTLPMEALEFADDAQRTLVARPGPLKDYKAHVETLDRLREAVGDRRKLDVAYRAYGRSKSERHVFRPYCLTFADGSIYAIGHSELRDKMRTLLVERIESARVLEDRFTRPKDFDAEEYLSESFGIWREDQTYEVKIEFSKEVAQLIREREWHPSQRLEERRNGRVLLTMRVTGLPQVVSWVLSYGHQAKAIAPEELVDRVSEALRLAARWYQQPPTTKRNWVMEGTS